MIVDKKLKKYFINLMISEDQAIGIYEAELFLNISPKDIFRKILLEEIFKAFTCDLSMLVPVDGDGLTGPIVIRVSEIDLLK